MSREAAFSPLRTRVLPIPLSRALAQREFPQMGAAEPQIH
jgi:hypothetical protein